MINKIVYNVKENKCLFKIMEHVNVKFICKVQQHVKLILITKIKITYCQLVFKIKAM